MQSMGETIWYSFFSVIFCFQRYESNGGQLQAIWVCICVAVAFQWAFHSMTNAPRQKTNRWIRNIQNKSNRFDRRFLWMSLTVFSYFVAIAQLFCFSFRCRFFFSNVLSWFARSLFVEVIPEYMCALHESAYIDWSASVSARGKKPRKTV